MRKDVGLDRRPGALVVLTYSYEILLNEHARDMVDREQLPGQRRFVRLGVALREVEAARRFQTQFDGLAR